MHIEQLNQYTRNDIQCARSCPNENDGTTMPVIDDIKEWIRSRALKKFLSFINKNNTIFFGNLLFIFISMFDLTIILLKNKLNGNKNNFITAVLI